VSRKDTRDKFKYQARRGNSHVGSSLGVIQPGSQDHILMRAALPVPELMLAVTYCASTCRTALSLTSVETQFNPGEG